MCRQTPLDPEKCLGSGQRRESVYELSNLHHLDLLQAQNHKTWLRQAPEIIYGMCSILWVIYGKFIQIIGLKAPGMILSLV